MRINSLKPKDVKFITIFICILFVCIGCRNEQTNRGIPFNDNTATQKLIDSLTRRKDLHEVQYKLDSAIAINPNKGFLYYNRAVVYIMEQSFENAEDDIKKCISLNYRVEACKNTLIFISVLKGNNIKDSNSI